jgi:hypothetical protein
MQATLRVHGRAAQGVAEGYRRSLGAYCRGASRRERVAVSRGSGQQHLLLDGRGARKMLS